MCEASLISQRYWTAQWWYYCWFEEVLILLLLLKGESDPIRVLNRGLRIWGEGRVVGKRIGDDTCMGGRFGCGSSGDPDQAVEDEAKNKSTTVFSSRASGAGYGDIIEDIGVAYALVGVSSSVIALICVPHRIRHNQKKKIELVLHQENGNLLFGTLRHLLMLSNALGGFFYLHLLSKNSKSSSK